jgi:maltose operon periplasmic protein
MYKTNALVLFAGLILGCASTPPIASSVSSVATCCSSIADARYGMLQLETKESVRITDTSPVFEFTSGRSYFAAFELGQSELVRAIDIEMSLSSSWLPSATVFLPSLVFLNAKKQATRVVSELQVQQLNNFWTGGYYFTRVEVKPDESHVIVYTDVKAVGQTIPFNNSSSGAIFMAGKTPIYIPGSASTHRLARDVGGVISLKTRG